MGTIQLGDNRGLRKSRGRCSVFSLFFGRDATRKLMTAKDRRFCYSPVLQGEIGQFTSFPLVLDSASICSSSPSLRFDTRQTRPTEIV